MSQREDEPSGKRLLGLAVAAVGVVYGDIGTSPLYTLKLAFGHEYGLEVNEANVLGVLSLVFWSLMLVVTLKYVTVIMRADNKGEGGIMALMALAQRSLPLASELSYVVGILGIFGAALFFGDGMITPAISVLSAVEGLEVAAPKLEHVVVPVTLLVLIMLFAFQRRGTEKVGALFGPIMLVWFLAIAVLGAMALAKQPQVLAALNPVWGAKFFVAHGIAALWALGAVVLAVTGGEALYADMGHFGRAPIRIAWTTIVLPALMLNYLGQGALMLSDHDAASNPFYRLVPPGLLVGMVVLATLAAVIASQAVISGAFSVARQAMQLGYLPRLETRHTSEETIGQVYVPWINRLLLSVVVILVLGFRSSDSLAAAYGVSVTGTMLIDTLLLGVVANARWHLRPSLVATGLLLFLSIDLAFLVANSVKFFEGAWFPFALGVVIFTVMRTWRRGRHLMSEETRRDKQSLAAFLRQLKAQPVARVPGTAVFLTASNDVVPHALLANLKYNRVLHQRCVLLTVETLDTPRADEGESTAVVDLGQGFNRITLRLGFMEAPNVPRALAALGGQGISLDPAGLVYFASRETVVPSKDKGMPMWRDKLFAFMSRNTVSATRFFQVPGNQLVEIGTQVEI
jgi:KUP system potassium uptake protein